MSEAKDLQQLLKTAKAQAVKGEEKITPALTKWTEEMILRQVTEIGLQFVPRTDINEGYKLQPENKAAVIAIAYYFLKDDRCQEYQCQNGRMSLKKGLMLMGEFGTGKTLTMRIMQRWFRNPFILSICKNIVDDYQSGGQVPATYAYLGRKSFDVNVFSKEGELDGRRPITRLFDELGYERLKHNFQDDRNVLEEILSARYDGFVYGNPPMITHVTTNLPLEKLAERYGHRLADRFIEMFNIIIFKGESMRK